MSAGRLELLLGLRAALLRAFDLRPERRLDLFFDGAQYPLKFFGFRCALGFEFALHAAHRAVYTLRERAQRRVDALTAGVALGVDLRHVARG